MVINIRVARSENGNSGRAVVKQVRKLGAEVVCCLFPAGAGTAVEQLTKKFS